MGDFNRPNLCVNDRKRNDWFHSGCITVAPVKARTAKIYELVPENSVALLKSKSGT